ncbi:hypothetical protein ABVT39_015166 [Epinephelus coioides]
MAQDESLVSLNGTQISYIGNDCKDIPDFLGDTYGNFAKRLDLSFNQLRWSECHHDIKELNEC